MQILRMPFKVHLHSIMGFQNMKKRVDTLYTVGMVKKKRLNF